jgi:hypothetical protein
MSGPQSGSPTVSVRGYYAPAAVRGGCEGLISRLQARGNKIATAAWRNLCGVKVKRAARPSKRPLYEETGIVRHSLTFRNRLYFMWLCGFANAWPPPYKGRSQFAPDVAGQMLWGLKGRNAMPSGSGCESAGVR